MWSQGSEGVLEVKEGMGEAGEMKRIFKRGFRRNRAADTKSGGGNTDERESLLAPQQLSPYHFKTLKKMGALLYMSTIFRWSSTSRGEVWK